MAKVTLKDFNTFKVNFDKSRPSSQRFGQAFMNEFHITGEDYGLWEKKNEKEALDIIFSHFIDTKMTASLDEIASELEQVDPRLALALDQVSDRLENRE